MKLYDEDKLCDIIDKLSAKCLTLEKKKRLWGLNEKDKEKLIEVKYEFLKYNYLLIDTIFNNHIEPLLYNDDIIDLKQELLNDINWEGQLLLDNEDIEIFLSKIKNNKDLIINKINILKLLEIKSMLDLEVDLFNEETFEIFCKLPFAKMEDDESYEDSIIKYIEMKYDFIIAILGGEFDEKSFN